MNTKSLDDGADGALHTISIYIYHFTTSCARDGPRLERVRVCGTLKERCANARRICAYVLMRSHRNHLHFRCVYTICMFCVRNTHSHSLTLYTSLSENHFGLIAPQPKVGGGGPSTMAPEMAMYALAGHLTQCVEYTYLAGILERA